jgi:hypothetical protein
VNRRRIRERLIGRRRSRYRTAQFSRQSPDLQTAVSRDAEQQLAPSRRRQRLGRDDRVNPWRGADPPWVSSWGRMATRSGDRGRRTQLSLSDDIDIPDGTRISLAVLTRTCVRASIDESEPPLRTGIAAGAGASNGCEWGRIRLYPSGGLSRSRPSHSWSWPGAFSMASADPACTKTKNAVRSIIASLNRRVMIQRSSLRRSRETNCADSAQCAHRCTVR